MSTSITIKNGMITAIDKIERGFALNIDGIKQNYDNGFVYPGFTDHHGHVAALGKKISGAPLSNCRSADECIELLRRNKCQYGGWIVEYGWNNENFDNKSFPAKELIDEAFPDIPVYLIRIDGHAAWINSKALAAAGINSHSPNPYGGIIAKNKAGQPTGILIDNAMNLVNKIIPPFSASEIEIMIAKAVEELAAKGITTAYDMDVDIKTVEVYKSMADAGKLPIKINIFLKAQQDEWVKCIPYPFAKGNINVCGLKFYADGALGSRGAALTAGYKDAPANKGLLLITEDALHAKARKGIENGWQIAAHAIGDAANKLVINAYERLRKDNIAAAKNILRIEHGQILTPDDVNRLAENDIIASVQPIHCTSDVPMANERLNKEALRNSYRWKSLMDAGVTILGGSDFPIESHNPLLGIDAFVNRIPDGSDKAWNADERLSVDEAIKCYTFNDNIMTELSGNGCINVGDKADFVILSRDIRNITLNEIKEAKVLATYCDGKKVYEGKANGHKANR